MTTTSPPSTSKARVRVQRFGTFISGMILPNIAAFIAWGLITALFIATGWAPNGLLGGFDATVHPETLPDGASWDHPIGLVGPMITYLLPLLIANTGGRMVYGVRGGVVATIATMGVIVGAGVPMFLGAMIMGPLAAWLMKKIDAIWAGKIRPGFEMLVDNYSAGILGFGLALGGFFGIGPAVTWLSGVLGGGVHWLIQTGLLPLASIFVEPAKVLFLNNAINHGVLTPLGIDQAAEAGKSIFYMIESNPGPGLGILLAFSVFGVGLLRTSAPGAIVIQFLGGIHEIYFPYVLSKPLLLLGAIAGGATGVATNLAFNSGLIAPASPGSIFAVLQQTERNSYVGVILSIVFSAAVSFLVSAIIIRASRKRDLEAVAAGDTALADAVAKNSANKGRDSKVGDLLNVGGTATATKVRTIVFACDAGMGSSAMGATVLRNKVKKAGITGVTVTNASIANLEDNDTDLIITQQELTARATEKAPHAQHISVDNFMNSPKYDEVVDLVKNQQQ